MSTLENFGLALTSGFMPSFIEYACPFSALFGHISEQDQEKQHSRRGVEKGGLGKIGKRPGALSFHWRSQAVMPGTAATRPPTPPAPAALGRSPDPRLTLGIPASNLLLSRSD